MIRLSEIPVLLYLSFMIVYFTAGNRDVPVWSGLFFCVNYIVIGACALRQRSRVIKIILLSMSSTMFIYNALKYIFSYEFEKQFTLILLLICIFGFYKLQKTK